MFDRGPWCGRTKVHWRGRALWFAAVFAAMVAAFLPIQPSWAQACTERDAAWVAVGSYPGAEVINVFYNSADGYYYVRLILPTGQVIDVPVHRRC